MAALVSAGIALNAAVRLLTLHDAPLGAAHAHRPQLRQAHADTEAAEVEATAPPDVELTVRATFFGALANRALVPVAEETTQIISAELQLATARAQLIHTLGRRGS